MNPHVHINAPTVFATVAIVVLLNAIGKTFAAKHHESAWAQGLSWVI